VRRNEMLSWLDGVGATVGRDDGGQDEQTEQQVAMGMSSRLP